MDYWLLPLLVFIVWLSLGLRIASEDERFATFITGKFAGLKGPGLVLLLPGAAPQYLRVRLGMEGESQSYEPASFEGRAVPITAEKSIKAGNKVKITGFDENGLRVQAIPSFLICEKCGHRNQL